MLSLDLNLASRPFRNNMLLWLSFGLALSGLLALSVWNVRTYRERTELAVDLRTQQARLRQELEVLDRRDRSAQKDVEKFDLDILSVEAEKANEVIRWKAFSWTRLFNRLQEVQPNDVQMLSVRPVFRTESRQRSGRVADFDEGMVPVSVEGVAKTLQDFFEFERRLVSGSHFDRVEPEGTRIDPNGGETSFDLRFLYDPHATGDDLRAALTAPPAAASAAAEGAPEQIEPDLPAQVTAPTGGDEIVAATGTDEPRPDEPIVAPEVAPVAGTAPVAPAAAPGQQRPARSLPRPVRRPGVRPGSTGRDGDR